MIPRKLVETAFRRLWIGLIPVVLAPLMVITLVHHSSLYESTATAWVTRANDNANLSLDPANTAAKAQASTLTDLLATENFREGVAIQAGMVTTDSLPADLQAAASVLSTRIAIVQLGPNLVAIKASAESAELAQRIAAGVIAEYQARTAADTTQELQTVVDYFTKQVGLAQDDLTATRTALLAYVQAHPGVDKTATDPTYLQLQSTAAAQSTTVDKLTQSLQDARLQVATGGAVTRDLTFTVQDAPNLPGARLGVAAAKRLGYPLAALFLGLIIGGGYLYLSYRSDHSIRSRDDLLGLGVPVLGYVPDLRPREARLLRGYTPLRWVATLRRDYGRRVAASISPLPEDKRIAS